MPNTRKRRDDGTFDRDGPNEVLVTRMSATSRLIYSSPEKTFAIDESHSRMVKFSRGSHHIDVVISHIESIITSRRDDETRDGRALKTDTLQQKSTSRVQSIQIHSGHGI